MSGVLYGIGVGPGDPELVTLKAVRIMAGAPVIAYPTTEEGESMVRAIAAPHLPDGRIEIMPLPGPATERLSSSAVMAEVCRGLEPYLGRAADLVLGVPVEVAQEANRVTEREVQADTLSALFRQEPRLREAVEELDLELMD